MERNEEPAPLGFTTRCAYGKADADWLGQLSAAVPLLDGRMEIVADWRATGAQMLLGIGGAVFVLAALLLEQPRDWLAGLLMAGGALLAAIFAVQQGRQTVAAWRRRPVLTLSRQHLIWRGETLPWSTVTDITGNSNSLGGHSRHECRLTLADGRWRHVNLDRLDLPPRRVMLLIDFYWSASHDGLPPWHWQRRFTGAPD